MATNPIQQIFSPTVQAVSNLNNATSTGLYSFSSSTSNAPIADANGNVLVIKGPVAITQIAVTGNRLFVRRYAGASTGWNAWAEK